MLGFSPCGLPSEHQVAAGGDVPFHHLALAEVHHLGAKGKGVRTSVTGGIEQTEVIAYAHTFVIELLSPDLQLSVAHMNEK